MSKFFAGNYWVFTCWFPHRTWRVELCQRNGASKVLLLFENWS